MLARALASVPVVLALGAAPVATDLVFQADEGDWITGVQLVEKDGTVEISVFDADGLLSGPVPFRGEVEDATLGAGERWVFSQDGSHVGRSLVEGGKTLFELLDGLERVRTRDLEAGTRFVLADGGETVVAVTSAEQGFQSEIEIRFFRREGDRFREKKEPVAVRGFGGARLSRDGRRVVFLADEKLHVWNTEGDGRPRVVAEEARAFDAASDADVQVVLGPREVTIFRGVERSGSVSMDHRPVAAAFGPDGHVAVVDRSMVVLVDPEGAELFRIGAPEGFVNRSVAVAHAEETGLRVAVGSMRVIERPRRVEGQFRPGRAVARVEVRDAGSGFLGSTEFQTQRWSHASPELRMALGGRVVLFHTGDAVHALEVLAVPEADMSDR